MVLLHYLHAHYNNLNCSLILTVFFFAPKVTNDGAHLEDMSDVLVENVHGLKLICQYREYRYRHDRCSDVLMAFIADLKIK